MNETQEREFGKMGVFDGERGVLMVLQNRTRTSMHGLVQE